MSAELRKQLDEILSAISGAITAPGGFEVVQDLRDAQRLILRAQKQISALNRVEPRDFRSFVGISQEALSEFLSVNIKTVQNWEQGVTLTPDWALRALGRALLKWK